MNSNKQFFLEKTEKAFTNEQPRATSNIEQTRYRKTTNKTTPPPHKKANKNKQTYKQIKNTQHNTEKDE
jgi:hypothetical protein